MKRILLSLLILGSLSLTSCEFLEQFTDGGSSANESNEQVSVDSLMNGIRTNYRPDGTLLSKVPYKDSLRHGTGYSYYPEGGVQLEITYAKGRKHGMEKYFYEDGKVYRATYYREGRKDSLQTFYHKNGKLMATVPYKEGLLCVGTREYKDNGEELSSPEIKAVVKDETAFNSRVTIDLSMTRRMKKIEYYNVEDTENLPCPKFLSGYNLDPGRGTARYTQLVNKGDFFMKELVFLVECRSYHHIPYKVIQRVNVSVSNR